MPPIGYMSAQPSFGPGAPIAHSHCFPPTTGGFEHDDPIASHGIGPPDELDAAATLDATAELAATLDASALDASAELATLDASAEDIAVVLTVGAPPIPPAPLEPLDAIAPPLPPAPCAPMPVEPAACPMFTTPPADAVPSVVDPSSLAIGPLVPNTDALSNGAEHPNTPQNRTVKNHFIAFSRECRMRIVKAMPCARTKRRIELFGAEIMGVLSFRNSRACWEAR